MEEYLGSISVPAIAAAVYFIIKLIRHAVGQNAKFEKFVPLISAGMGVAFSVICFYALPAVIPATNVVVAIVIGAASGFTAIGTDQMVKQFGKKGDKPEPDQTEPESAETEEPKNELPDGGSDDN